MTCATIAGRPSAADDAVLWGNQEGTPPAGNSEFPAAQCLIQAGDRRQQLRSEARTPLSNACQRGQHFVDIRQIPQSINL